MRRFLSWTKMCTEHGAMASAEENICWLFDHNVWYRRRREVCLAELIVEKSTPKPFVFAVQVSNQLRLKIKQLFET